MIVCKSNSEIAKMGKAGKVVGEALSQVRKKIKPGLTTASINQLVEEVIIARGAHPASKGYHGFPAASCISINDEVVHGIPGDRAVKNGDIVSVDVTVELNGYYADGAATFPVGEVSHLAKKLINVTKKALRAGILKAKAGNRLYDISAAIQDVAESQGFSVVREYVGHGIGLKMHEEPQIPNYRQAEKGPELVEGMVFALEPMINVGDYQVKVDENNWTVRTVDGSLSAHFEHTVAVTNTGPLVLTELAYG